VACSLERTLLTCSRVFFPEQEDLLYAKFFKTRQVDMLQSSGSRTVWTGFAQKPLH